MIGLPPTEGTLESPSAAETWNRSPSFPDYEISSEGRVRRLTSRTSTRAGRIIKAILHYRGYLQHGLAKDRKTVTVRLNRLVCEAFHGKCPSRQHEAAHLDGDRSNNRASNLRWATKLENEADKDRHVNRPRGTAMRNAKLTEDVVAEIRRLAQSKSFNVKETAARLGVSKGNIRHVVKGRSWPHVK
jgi:hypothetical protein